MPSSPCFPPTQSSLISTPVMHPSALSPPHSPRHASPALTPSTSCSTPGCLHTSPPLTSARAPERVRSPHPTSPPFLCSTHPPPHQAACALMTVGQSAATAILASSPAFVTGVAAALTADPPQKLIPISEVERRIALDDDSSSLSGNLFSSGGIAIAMLNDLTDYPGALEAVRGNAHCAL